MNDIIKTLKYEKYSIDLKENKPKCICFNYLLENKENISKENIFISIYNLGKNIYKNISDDKLLIIFPLLEKLIKKNSDSKYYEKDFFLNLNEIILDSNIKTILIQWFNEYGIPNFYYEKNNILEKLINFEDNSNNEKLKNSITYANNSYGISFIPEILEDFNKKYKYEIDLLPLVNIALIIYFTYAIKNRISNLRTKKLDILLKPFPYISDVYKNKYSKHYNITDDEQEKNMEVIRKINNYLKKLIYYFQEYLKNEISITNSTEIIFSNNNPIPTIENPWVDYTFLDTQYISFNPFLTAFEYLLQVLPNKTSIMSYCCEECNEIIRYKQHLCYDCKIKLYNEVLSKYKKNNKTIKYKDIKDEYENLLEDINAYTPLIEKIYNDRQYQKSRYNKVKNSFKNKLTIIN